MKLKKYEKHTYPAKRPTRSPIPGQPGPGGSYAKGHWKPVVSKPVSDADHGHSGHGNSGNDATSQSVFFG